MEDRELDELKDGVKNIAGGTLKTVLTPVLLLIGIAILVLSLIIGMFFSPALALKEAGKSLYAALFNNGDEETIDLDEMEEYWYDPANVKEHLDEFFDAMSVINDGVLYVTKDNFELILDKAIAYRESVREVDNTYRYYQHHYKVVITYQGPKAITTGSDDDSSGSTDDTTDDSSTTDNDTTETTAAVCIPDKALCFSETVDETSLQQIDNQSVFDISLTLPKPVRWFCSLFEPTIVYADEITLSVVAEGEDTTTGDSDADSSDGFLMWPLPEDYKKITSKYGPRNAPVEGASTFHRGIDISCPVGTQVYAAEAGTVITADDGWHGGGGTTIFIDHGNGYYTCYMHLSELKVSVGDVVTKGQLIALSGNTGRSSGPHLHFGVYSGGSSKEFAVNPSLYFDGSYNLTGPNDGMVDDGRYDSPAYKNDTPISIAPAPEPEVKDITNGDPYVVDGITYQDVTTYEITDYEDKMQIGHWHNTSLESETLFAVSWHEIYTAAAIKSVTGNAEQENWETESKFHGKLPGDGVSEDEEVTIDAIARLDEATINQIIDSFSFGIGYYFDPTSAEQMPTCGDTYAEHVYSYDEMEDYAYIYTEIGTNVEHGTEVFPPGTADFDYYEYKKPAIAPAIAENAYMTVEYDYKENGDGTATLQGRQVIIDGQAFNDYMTGIIGDGFQLEWYCDFIKHLPGANYNNMQEQVGASIGSLADRFDMVLESYESGQPYSYYDTNFPGVGQVILGKNCSRTNITYTPRRDGDGNLIGGSNVDETVLGITIDDITDEQIRQDIANGLYTLDDLVYMAACLQVEADHSVDGEVSVAWCIMNRRPDYNNSVKEVVTARTASGKKEFNSPWENYLDGSYSAQCQNVAAGVLRGDIANPIGDCYFFFTASTCWGYKPGTYHINIGGNMFYITWGDVTQVVGREGYVPF